MKISKSHPQVDGQKYTGQGRSKKVARIEAAATALRSFIQFKDGAILQPLKPTLNLDFTSDEHLENGTSKLPLDSSKCKEFLSNLGNAELVELVVKYLAHVKLLKKYNLGWNFGMASKYSDFYFVIFVFLLLFILYTLLFSI